jgi:hypothetical protein
MNVTLHDMAAKRREVPAFALKGGVLTGTKAVVDGKQRVPIRVGHQVPRYLPEGAPR